MNNAIQWTGTPIFNSPSHIDKKKESLIFHRDHAGQAVVLFAGDNHRRDADLFCKMFGEASGWRPTPAKHGGDQ